MSRNSPYLPVMVRSFCHGAAGIADGEGLAVCVGVGVGVEVGVGVAVGTVVPSAAT